MGQYLQSGEAIIDPQSGELSFHRGIRLREYSGGGVIEGIVTNFDGAYLVEASIHGDIVIRNIATSDEVKTFEVIEDNEDYPTDFALSTDSQTIMVISRNGRIISVDPTMDEVHQIANLDGTLWAVDWHPTENYFLVAGSYADGSSLLEMILPDTANPLFSP